MVKLEASSTLPTKHGIFDIYAFLDEKGKEHIALVKGKISPAEIVAVRIHSKCFTGDTLGSMRCDCNGQLEAALNYINEHGGVLVYLDQEGRGIGLANKIKAYALQDQGFDTVEANRKLGFGDDMRDYLVAVKILESLGVKRIRLLTNNPEKLEGVKKNGIVVVERIALITKTNKYNKKYIETKKEKLHQLL